MESETEMRMDVSTLVEAQKRADEAKLRIVCMISREFAVDFRTQLHARLNRLEEYCSGLKVIERKLDSDYYWHYSDGDDPRDQWTEVEKQEYQEVQNMRSCISGWRRSTTHRIERMERLLARVDTWQACSHCWRGLPAHVSGRILRYALQSCLPQQEVWETYDNGESNYCRKIDEVTKQFRDLTRRIFDLSLVSKSTSVHILPALEYLVHELDELENEFEWDASQRQDNWEGAYESDSWYANYHDWFVNAEKWLAHCRALRDHAYRLQCITSAWSRGGIRNLPLTLKYQLESSEEGGAFALPDMEHLQDLIQGRRKGYRGLRSGEDVLQTFKPWRRKFAKLYLISVTFPNRWLLERLGSHVSDLYGIECQIRKLIAETADESVEARRWLEQVVLWRKHDHDMLGKIGQWCRQRTRAWEDERDRRDFVWR